MNDFDFLCSEYDRLGFRYNRERLEYLVRAYHELISAYEASESDSYERSHIRTQAMQMFQTFDQHVMNPSYIEFCLKGSALRPEEGLDPTKHRETCGHFYGAFLHYIQFVSPYSGGLTFRKWLKGSALRPEEGLTS